MEKNPLSEEGPFVNVQTDLQKILDQTVPDRSILKCERQMSNQEKWTFAFMAGILFLIVSSPLLYGIVNRLTTPLGLQFLESNGCPNVVGMVIHAIVFIVLIKYLMK